MTIFEFETLNPTEQEELIDTGARFIQTQVISQHLCDFYQYDDLYIVFYYLCNMDSVIHSKCLSDITGLKNFIKSLSNYTHQRLN